MPSRSVVRCDPVVAARDVDDAAGSHVRHPSQGRHPVGRPTSLSRVLILLPPSEGKTARPTRQAARPGHAVLPGARPTPDAQVLDALVELCRGDPDAAARRSASAPGQADLVARNADLRTAPTARADRVYTGVLYDALGLARPARRRPAPGDEPGRGRLARCSGWSAPATASRPTGSPATPRCPASARWPACGARHLGAAVARGRRHRAARRPPLHDVRRVLAARRPTSPGGWSPCGCCTRSDGRRTVVSHFNKATKGRLVRGLLEDGANPGHGARPGRHPRAAGLDGRGRRTRPVRDPARRGGHRGLSAPHQRWPRRTGRPRGPGC